VRAYRALSRFRRDADLGSWLYRIVFNACVDELRRARRQAAPFDMTAARGTAWDQASPAPGPERAVVARDSTVWALARLPDIYRVTVVLVDGEAGADRDRRPTTGSRFRAESWRSRWAVRRRGSRCRPATRRPLPQLLSGIVINAGGCREIVNDRELLCCGHQFGDGWWSRPEPVPSRAPVLPIYRFLRRPGATRRSPSDMSPGTWTGFVNSHAPAGPPTPARPRSASKAHQVVDRGSRSASKVRQLNRPAARRRVPRRTSTPHRVRSQLLLAER